MTKRSAERNIPVAISEAKSDEHSRHAYLMTILNSVSRERLRSKVTYAY